MDTYEAIRTRRAVKHYAPNQMTGKEQTLRDVSSMNA